TALLSCRWGSDAQNRRLFAAVYRAAGEPQPCNRSKPVAAHPYGERPSISRASLKHPRSTRHLDDVRYRYGRPCLPHSVVAVPGAPFACVGGRSKYGVAPAIRLRGRFRDERHYSRIFLRRGSLLGLEDSEGRRVSLGKRLCGQPRAGILEDRKSVV